MHFALAGASTVIICGRSAAPLDETKSAAEAAAPGCTVLPIPTDVIDKDSVQQLFDNLPRTPDVLVNNAGVGSAYSSIKDSSIDLWWADWVRLIEYLVKANNVEREINSVSDSLKRLCYIGNQRQRPLPFHTLLLASIGRKAWSNS